MRKLENMRLVIVEKPNFMVHGDYSYLISDMYAYTAFKTQKGYESWLKRSNVKTELIEEFESEEHGKTEIYKIHGAIEERSFYKLEEIPNGATKYKDLSNGRLVDCYYIHTENGCIVYRPNPNAKDVYKPLPLDEHIAYMRING
jgi:hypothetical protein